jgi:hypothetical protein
MNNDEFEGKDPYIGCQKKIVWIMRSYPAVYQIWEHGGSDLYDCY